MTFPYFWISVVWPLIGAAEGVERRGQTTGSPWSTNMFRHSTFGMPDAPPSLPEGPRLGQAIRPFGASDLKSYIIAAQQFHDDAGQDVRAVCEKEFHSLPSMAIDLDPEAGMWDLVSARQQVGLEVVSAINAYQQNLIDMKAIISQYKHAISQASRSHLEVTNRQNDADNAVLRFCIAAFTTLGVDGSPKGRKSDKLDETTLEGVCEGAPSCHCPNSDTFCVDQERALDCAQVFAIYSSVWKERCRRSIESEALQQHFLKMSNIVNTLEEEGPAADQGNFSITKLLDFVDLSDRFQASLESTSRSLVEVLASIELALISAEDTK